MQKQQTKTLVGLSRRPHWGPARVNAASSNGHWGSGGTMGTRLDTKYPRMLKLGPKRSILDRHFPQKREKRLKFCLSASCAVGVRTGGGTGGASCRDRSWTSGAGGGGAVEHLHLLLLTNLHLEGLILLSSKLNTPNPISSGPCRCLAMAALAEGHLPTLDAVAIFLSS